MFSSSLESNQRGKSHSKGKSSISQSCHSLHQHPCSFVYVEACYCPIIGERGRTGAILSQEKDDKVGEVGIRECGLRLAIREPQWSNMYSKEIL